MGWRLGNSLRIRDAWNKTAVQGFGQPFASAKTAFA
jgi:hypothetical protein